jgi:hypothetical protein
MQCARLGAAVSAVLAVLVLLYPVSAAAQPNGQEIEQLRRDLEQMKRQMQQMQEMMRRQEGLIQKLEAESLRAAHPPAATTVGAGVLAAGAGPDDALDQALLEAEAAAPAAETATLSASPRALASARVGSATLRLIDISTDIMVAAGWSTADNDELDGLEGGAHDPQRRGFTLQQAEFSFSGAVDPYFRGDAFVIFTDEDVELEEAFLTTSSLPWGLQLEGGFVLSEFGLNNPRHPHEWLWVDQPVINSRLFGGDGLRSAGVRLGWLLPTPWFSQLHVGAQNADGDTTVSFLGGDGGSGHGHGDEEEGDDGKFQTTIGGRPAVFNDVENLGDLLYLARWENVGSWSLLDGAATARIGGSALFGPNASGRDERTWIYGTDLTVTWLPTRNFRGWPRVISRTEWMKRDFDAAAVAADGLLLPSTTLHDWGIRTELLYSFRYPWGAGLRYEYATGTGPSVGGRSDDPFRDNRHRLSPLLSYHPTEFSRIRLQYNWDDAEHLSSDESSVWTSFEILFGAHPAHRF